MHRLKKAIAELRNYLGRDTRGVSLLSVAEGIGNEVRKQVVVEKNRADTASESKRLSESALRDAKAEIQSLKLELRKEQVIRQQRERDVVALKREADKLQIQLDNLHGGPDEPLPSEINTDGLFDIPHLRAAVRSIRRRFRLCPRSERYVQPKMVSDFYHSYEVYELGSFMTKLSGEEFMSLGRFVAVMAIMNFPCIITSKRTIATMKKDDSGKDDERNVTISHFVRWIRKKFDDNIFAKMGHTRLQLGDQNHERYDHNPNYRDERLL